MGPAVATAVRIRKQESHQETRYSNVTSLYFAIPLAFNAPDGGVSLGRSP